jgi:taurine dioxygenase
VALWDEHGILLFRNQDVTADNQIAFSRMFGELEVHPISETRSQDYPALFTLVNDPETQKFLAATYQGRQLARKPDCTWA